ncbi:hypothetical protein B0O99DRAFT_642092 [Bisporella sp. PMI_857]|nr:hypothetical protein B0O99DRAFT_642092 [Bisporella sp. PMI_857]
MASNNSNIIFYTNSLKYFHKLIPKKYHTNSESTEPKCAITLRDRSLLQVNSIHQKVVIDVDEVERLSWLWPIVVPTLPGAPELNINLELVPKTILPTIESIISNIGHIEYYQLNASNDVGHISREKATALIKAHLQPVTSTSRIIEILDQIRVEEHSADKGVWVFDELLVAATKFLKALKDWDDMREFCQCVENRFEEEVMAQKANELSNFAVWAVATRKHRRSERLKELKIQRATERVLSYLLNGVFLKEGAESKKG